MSTEVTVPEILLTALAASPEARERFNRMPPSHRREYVSYIEEAKKEETRARRAEKTIAMLLEKKGA